jgi:ElaB/YqjD/DUF883 family membrane-anchored ribosome-binding protein
MAKNEAEAIDAGAASTTEQLRQQTETVREDLGQLGRLAKQAAKEKLGEARETAAGYYDHGRKKADELETQLVDYVRTKPLKSILIAAGVGALFGILISRR